MRKGTGILIAVFATLMLISAAAWFVCGVVNAGPFWHGLLASTTGGAWGGIIAAVVIACTGE